MEYSYNDLVNDLEIGHEIEFTHLNCDYSISHNDQGWHLYCVDTGNNQSFKDVGDLLNNGKILGKSLRDIWNSVNIRSIF